MSGYDKYDSYIFDIVSQLLQNQCKQQNKPKILCSFKKISVCDIWGLNHSILQKSHRWVTFYS
jgi:hypothetical protein